MIRASQIFTDKTFDALQACVTEVYMFIYLISTLYMSTQKKSKKKNKKKLIMYQSYNLLNQYLT